MPMLKQSPAKASAKKRPSASGQPAAQNSSAVPAKRKRASSLGTPSDPETCDAAITPDATAGDIAAMPDYLFSFDLWLQNEKSLGKKVRYNYVAAVKRGFHEDGISPMGMASRAYYEWVKEKAFGTHMLTPFNKFREFLAEHHGTLKKAADGQQMDGRHQKYRVFVCMHCKRGNHPSELLLCDEPFCDNAAHLSCCTPRLLRVPESQWFCPECQDARAQCMHCKRVDNTCELLHCGANGCKNAAHLYCCTPRLQGVPEAGWICDKCRVFILD